MAQGRPQRREVRFSGDGRRDLHAEALAPRRRHDPRAEHRSLFAGHPAAPRRQGTIRRPAFRRDGGVGARGLWGCPHAPGDPHREVRRRNRPVEGVRIGRKGGEPPQTGCPRVVQRPREGTPGSRPDGRVGRRRGMMRVAVRGARNAGKACPGLWQDASRQVGRHPAARRDVQETVVRT